MNILVLGAKGFVGRYFIKYTKHKNILKTSSKKKVGFIKFNILSDNLETIIDKYKIKKVIFLSAISKPEICEKEKLKSYLINVKKTKEIINKLFKKSIYFIFFSSEFVFDGKNGQYREISTPKTKLLYGKQKIKIENFLKNKKKGKFAILRISKTYGDNKKDGSLFTNLLNLNNKSPIIYSANNQYFSALYVRDLIKIMDIFIKNCFKGLYNVCGNESYSRYKYTTILFDFLEIKNVKIKPAKLYSLTSNKNLPLNVTMSNKKICKKLNFKFTSYEKFLRILKKKLDNTYHEKS